MGDYNVAKRPSLWTRMQVAVTKGIKGAKPVAMSPSQRTQPYGPSKCILFSLAPFSIDLLGRSSRRRLGSVETCPFSRLRVARAKRRQERFS